MQLSEEVQEELRVARIGCYSRRLTVALRLSNGESESRTFGNAEW